VGSPISARPCTVRLVATYRGFRRSRIVATLAAAENTRSGRRTVDVRRLDCVDLRGYPTPDSRSARWRGAQVNPNHPRFFESRGGVRRNRHGICVKLPAPARHAGLPIGVQIIGPYLEDRTTIGGLRRVRTG
jgi:hypothetical protein